MSLDYCNNYPLWSSHFELAFTHTLGTQTFFRHSLIGVLDIEVKWKIGPFIVTDVCCFFPFLPHPVNA